MTNYHLFAVVNSVRLVAHNALRFARSLSSGHLTAWRDSVKVWQGRRFEKYLHGAVWAIHKLLENSKFRILTLAPGGLNVPLTLATQNYAPSDTGTAQWTRLEALNQADEQLLGCYVLRTYQGGQTAAQAWELHTVLSQAEAGFRAIKGEERKEIPDS